MIEFDFINTGFLQALYHFLYVLFEVHADNGKIVLNCRNQLVCNRIPRGLVCFLGINVVLVYVNCNVLFVDTAFSEDRFTEVFRTEYAQLLFT